MAGTGSMLVVEVVPTVATTQKGSMPARLSSSTRRLSAAASMRNSESAGTLASERWPSPSAMRDFSTEECDCSDA
jgi:hypothetical protein